MRFYVMIRNKIDYVAGGALSLDHPHPARPRHSRQAGFRDQRGAREGRGT